MTRLVDGGRLQSVASHSRSCRSTHCRHDTPTIQLGVVNTVGTTDRSSTTGSPGRTLRRALAAGVAAVLTGVPACSNVSPGPQADPAPSGKDCTVDKLPLKNRDRLTIGTDEPVYPPWFSNDNPNNGKGFESAVAYQVADRLGFDKYQVDWVTSDFNQLISPGEKAFDIAIDQVSITKQRRHDLDVSRAYYTGPQAVITTEGNKISNVNSRAGLREAELGAQRDSTSYSAITTMVKPKTSPKKFDSNKQAAKELKKHHIDGLVTDLPTAIEMTTSKQVPDGLIVGKLPPLKEKRDSFGFVLDHGSKLTPCVNQTLKKMGSDGTLEHLQQRWLPTSSAAQLR